MIGLPIRDALPEVAGQGDFEIIDEIHRSDVPYAGADRRVLLSRGGAMEERVVDFVNQPIRNLSGAVTAVLVQGIDTTERKRAEAALRERDERLQLAVAIAHMGTFEIDPEADSVTVNEPGRAIYGWPSTRTTFTRAREQFHPDDRAAVMRQVDAALAPDRPAEFEVEHRIIRDDGEVRWLRVRGRAILADEAEPRRATLCIGPFLDVTDQQEAEESLRDSDRKADGDDPGQSARPAHRGIGTPRAGIGGHPGASRSHRHRLDPRTAKAIARE